MTFQDMRLALKATGVEDDFSELLIQYCRENGRDYEKLDELLVQEGYVKVFTDDFFGWDENEDEEYEYEYKEKIHHKPLWDE